MPRIWKGYESASVERATGATEENSRSGRYHQCNQQWTFSWTFQTKSILLLFFYQ